MDKPNLYTDPSGLEPQGWSETNENLANRFGVFGNGGDGYFAFFGIRLVNIALVPAGSNHEYVQDAKTFSQSEIKTLTVANIKDAINQITAYLGEDKRIKNLFLISHGAKTEAWFGIGATQYYTPSGTRGASNLKQIGGLFGDGGQCIVLSCHFGSSVNGGIEMARAVAANLNVPVFASKSWTASSATFGDEYLWGLINLPYSLTARDVNVPYNKSIFTKYAHDHVGKWIKVLPDGSLKEIMNVKIRKSGELLFDSTSPR